MGKKKDLGMGLEVEKIREPKTGFFEKAKAFYKV